MSSIYQVAPRDLSAVKYNMTFLTTPSCANGGNLELHEKGGGANWKYMRICILLCPPNSPRNDVCKNPLSVSKLT